MSNIKVLIVEDETVVAMDIKDRLEAFGYIVCGKASYGEKAIEKVKELGPDLVLMDIVLRGDMDGIEAAKIIRSQFKIPVVFVTAHADEEQFERAKLTNPFGYVLKPFRTRELIITIEMALYKDRRDVEKVEYEAQLALSQKMESIGILAAGIAHEINNPVGFITSNIDTLSNYLKNVDMLLGYYQQLCKSLKENNKDVLSDKTLEQVEIISEYENEIEIDYLREDIPELINDCKDGSKRVAKIVGDLKTFAHPGNDEQVSFNINEGIESTLNIVNNEIKYKAEIIKDFHEVPLVFGYPQKLNQVFMNILVNAAQAITKKGEIKIKTKKDGENVVVSISDNGEGIEKENLSKLFDPFFTTKEVGKGTGLGMNISYNIIKEHDGNIDVKSSPGKGTTFTITLPGQG